MAMVDIALATAVDQRYGCSNVVLCLCNAIPRTLMQPVIWRHRNCSGPDPSYTKDLGLWTLQGLGFDITMSFSLAELQEAVHEAVHEALEKHFHGYHSKSLSQPLTPLQQTTRISIGPVAQQTVKQEKDQCGMKAIPEHSSEKAMDTVTSHSSISSSSPVDASPLSTLSRSFTMSTLRGSAPCLGTARIQHASNLASILVSQLVFRLAFRLVSLQWYIRYAEDMGATGQE